MSDRLTAWFPLLLLAALAALTFWLDRTVRLPLPVRDGSTRHDPDYVVENFAAARIGKDGQTTNTLAARKMLHYPDDDSTRLEFPRFTHLGSAKAPMTITSRQALVSSNGENVYFIDDVVVTRAAYADKSALFMYTSYLHVIPDDHLARTDRPVRIVDANTTIHAVGLELNNETRVAKLLSNVRGSYQKPKQESRDAK